MDIVQSVVRVMLAIVAFGWEVAVVGRMARVIAQRL